MCSLTHAKLWPTLPVLELHVVYSTADLATSESYLCLLCACVYVCVHVCVCLEVHLCQTHFTHRETFQNSQCEEENCLVVSKATLMCSG